MEIASWKIESCSNFASWLFWLNVVVAPTQSSNPLARDNGLSPDPIEPLTVNMAFK